MIELGKNSIEIRKEIQETAFSRLCKFDQEVKLVKL